MSILHHVHHHAKKHYEKHYRAKYNERAHLVFMMDAFLVSCALGLLALGGYFNWFYHPLRDLFRVQVSTVGEVVGEQELGFSVSIENTGKRTLKNAHVRVYFPPTLLNSDGRPATVRTFDLKDLVPGVPIRFELRAYPMGAPHAEKVIVGFSADDGQGTADEKFASTDVVWTRSLVEATFNLPPAAVPGQNLVFRLHVKNGSSLPFTDVSMLPEWPKGFVLTRSTPPVYHGLIKIGDMPPGREADLEFSGRLAASAAPTRFGADVAGFFEGRPYPLTSASSVVTMVDAGLKLEAAFPEPAPGYVKTGQDVPVEVRYANQGEKTVQHLTLSIKADAASIASVHWSEGDSIDALAPGASGTRTATIRLRDPISQYATDPTLQVLPQASFDIPEIGLKNVQVDGTTTSVKIAGDATLRLAARYFTNEGDQIGRGPLPPKVGKPTTYWILASLQTGSSQIKESAVTFTLPEGVAYTGRAAVSGGDDLRQEGNRLIWNLGTVEAHASVDFEAPSASFEVSLTPTADQIGTSPHLLNIAMFTGTDAWTGIDLSSNQDGLTTKLTGDLNVGTRTVVVK